MASVGLGIGNNIVSFVSVTKIVVAHWSGALVLILSWRAFLVENLTAVHFLNVIWYFKLIYFSLLFFPTYTCTSFVTNERTKSRLYILPRAVIVIHVRAVICHGVRSATKVITSFALCVCKRGRWELGIFRQHHTVDTRQAPPQDLYSLLFYSAIPLWSLHKKRGCFLRILCAKNSTLYYYISGCGNKFHQIDSIVASWSESASWMVNAFVGKGRMEMEPLNG